MSATRLDDLGNPTAAAIRGRISVAGAPSSPLVSANVTDSEDAAASTAGLRHPKNYQIWQGTRSCLELGLDRAP